MLLNIPISIAKFAIGFQHKRKFARIIDKVSTLTILQHVNFINNKPIGKIKYALN